jgi:hypothetical protein
LHIVGHLKNKINKIDHRVFVYVTVSRWKRANKKTCQWQPKKKCKIVSINIYHSQFVLVTTFPSYKYNLFFFVLFIKNCQFDLWLKSNEKKNYPSSTLAVFSHSRPTNSFDYILIKLSLFQISSLVLGFWFEFFFFFFTRRQNQY